MVTEAGGVLLKLLPVSLTLTATVTAEVLAPVRVTVKRARCPSLTDTDTAAIVTSGKAAGSLSSTVTVAEAGAPAV